MALNQVKILNKPIEKHREYQYSKIHIYPTMKLDIFSAYNLKNQKIVLKLVKNAICRIKL
jgi:hypothetical protein